MNRPYRYVSVDDEPAAHRALRSLMQRHPRFEAQGAYCDPVLACAELASQSTDLLFLDIEMPVLSGLQLLKELEKPPVTIMVTAHQDFALEGFELGVRDYLLKPVSPERVNVSLERVLPILDLHRRQKDQGLSASLPFKDGHATVFVSPAEIRFIDAEGPYSRLVLQNQTLLVTEALKQLDDRLRPFGFVRIHKSHLINRRHLARLDGERVYTYDDLYRHRGRAYKDRLDL